METKIKASEVAAPYLAEVRAQVAELGEPLRLVGILSSETQASDVYANYAAQGCAKVGIEFERRHATPEGVSGEIYRASEDPTVHGIIVFYPVFGGTRDRSLQNEVAPEKDVEGLHTRWSRLLYNDQRHIDPERIKKAILPCTSLGIVKALRHMGNLANNCPPREAARGQTITIFNRSEVVGRPLAAMLAHDGAKVYSFDIDGPLLYEGRETLPTSVDRATALAESTVVITGVPSTSFPLLRGAELREGASVINFSHVKNLDPSVSERAGQILKRVGPITVAMLLRNTLRLYRNAQPTS
ncbi:MAG: bifunctional methylenetetrahydrofolate dehydrogenase/methenyltetrahydrofolate cyclohydrolase [Planctomycetes bacterium]|nr:bifunctional methylenetetrahydrofolate dehydrogenase/methenyltetrahydrofolate cyclohydrolase [Planctomycetota bacterium]